MKKVLMLLLIILLFFNLQIFSQISVQKIEKINLASNEQFNAPKFSPDGNSIFFTNMNYDGIWKYSLITKTFSQITNDPKSGFEFCILPDGNKLAYRRTFYDQETNERTQELVLADINLNTKELIAKGNDISVPTFANGNLLYSDGIKTKNLFRSNDPTNISILGIENTKIALNKYGEKILYDPFGNGNYCWPFLSNDKKRIVAYELDRGTFIADLDGNVIKKFGRLDAAVWSNNDKWLFYMNTKDDGDKIISSEIVAISTDNFHEYYLTNTKDQIELNPSCSPKENKIVYNTSNGEIFIVTFSEE